MCGVCVFSALTVVLEAERVRGRRGKWVWSEITTGGDPPQGDQFNRAILDQPGYKCSSTLAAPTDQRGESDCQLQSYPGIETEDDHSESVLVFLFPSLSLLWNYTLQAEMNPIYVLQTRHTLFLSGPCARPPPLRRALHLCRREWHSWQQTLRGLRFHISGGGKRIHGQYMFCTGGQQQHLCACVCGEGRGGWDASLCVCASWCSWRLRRVLKQAILSMTTSNQSIPKWVGIFYSFF